MSGEPRDLCTAGQLRTPCTLCGGEDTWDKIDTCRFLDRIEKMLGVEQL